MEGVKDRDEADKEGNGLGKVAGQRSSVRGEETPDEE